MEGAWTRAQTGGMLLMAVSSQTSYNRRGLMRTLTAVAHTEHDAQVWPTVGEYGIVPISSIVESPYNPRKHFDDEETA